MFTLLALLAQPAHATRTKDIGQLEGQASALLTGVGVVTGLAGTGDSARNQAAQQAFLVEAQANGVVLDPDAFTSRNIALVNVTAELGVDAREGHLLDLTVSAVGDAKSLQGGTLATVLLRDMEGVVYAIGSGSVSVGGYAASSGAGDSVQKNHLTVGHAPNAGRVVQEHPRNTDYNALTEVEFVLDDADWTSATRMASAVNDRFGAPIATPTSASTVLLHVPEEYQGRFGWFAAELEQVDVVLDRPAVVVINARTGTVVMGADVRIAPVALAHGGLLLEVEQDVTVSQPAMLSGGTTEVVVNGGVEATQIPGELTLVQGTSIGELVTALNAMGVSPSDLVVILQMIEAAGALEGELRLQ